jgi:CHASE2 domain-containing sensor protein
MGRVFKAEDKRLGRIVALKFLTQTAASDRKALGRFRAEARAASALNHPNICTIYDIGECEAGTFIAMEFLEGRTLRQVLSEGRLKPASLIDLAIQIAQGLEAAHSRGIVHRDLKPENLMVADDGRLKILDFGIAKFVTDRQGSDLRHPDETTSTAQSVYSQIGVPVGTYSYMSPEQVRSEPVDVRSDLFSFGAVIFEMATRRRAFGGKSPADITAAILTHSPVLTGNFEPRFRTGLQVILDKALEKNVALRYQHAADIVADLKRLERDVSADRPPTPLTAAVGAASTPAFGRRLIVDLLKAAAVAVVVWLTYESFVNRASGKYLRQFQMAFIQESVRQGALQADFEAGGRHLPLIVDISALHPDKAVASDRRMLDRVITELRSHGARAIGVDLSFDDLAAFDFQYLHRWLSHKNVRVGIYKRAVERREAWLGRLEFAELAAGIALPQDNPQHAISFTRRWSSRLPRGEGAARSTADCTGAEGKTHCKDDLIQLPVALWLLSEQSRTTGGEGADDPRMAERLERLLTVQTSPLDERAAASQLELGTYVIDYSYLKELRRDIIRLESGADADVARQLYLNRAKIAERVVLIGDLEDTSDHLCNTTGREPLAGVLVHAVSLATLNQGMLFEARDTWSAAAAWFGLLFLVAVIAGLRLMHSGSRRLKAWPYEHLEILVFVSLAFGVVQLSRSLAQTTGTVWPQLLWIAGGLVLYPFAGSLHRALVAAPRMIGAFLPVEAKRAGEA